MRPVIRQLLDRMDNEIHREKYAHIHEGINERGEWEEGRVNNTLFFASWSRDCDMYEVRTKPRPNVASSLFKLHKSIQDARYDICDEGPGHVYLVPYKDLEVAVSQAYSSDRALAAFEDGHPQTITSLR